MRGKLAIFGGVVLSLVLAVVAGPAMAGEAPETTMIDDCVAKKAAVEFPHKAHADMIECATCHDVHNAAGYDPLLRLPIENSALCYPCHQK